MVYSPENQNMVNNPSFSFGGKLNHDKLNQSLASGACSPEKYSADHNPAYSFGKTPSR